MQLHRRKHKSHKQILIAHASNQRQTLSPCYSINKNNIRRKKNKLCTLILHIIHLRASLSLIFLCWPFLTFRAVLPSCQILVLPAHFLIDKRLVLLEALLDMNLELDNIIQDPLNLRMELFTQCSSADRELFVPTKTSAHFYTSK